MAEFVREGDEIVLRLDGVEKVEAIHGDVRFPAAAVESVEVIAEPLKAVHGIRAPGTGVPGVVDVGTFREGGSKTFAVVHHGMHQGVRVVLRGTDYDELIVGCDDPEVVAASLRAGSSATASSDTGESAPSES